MNHLTLYRRVKPPFRVQSTHYTDMAQHGSYSPLKIQIMDSTGNMKKPTETRTVALISVSSRVPTKVATDRTAHSTAPMREKNPKDITLVAKQLIQFNSH